MTHNWASVGTAWRVLMSFWITLFWTNPLAFVFFCFQDIEWNILQALEAEIIQMILYQCGIRGKSHPSSVTTLIVIIIFRVHQDSCLRVVKSGAHCTDVQANMKQMVKKTSWLVRARDTELPWTLHWEHLPLLFIFVIDFQLHAFVLPPPWC